MGIAAYNRGSAKIRKDLGDNYITAERSVQVWIERLRTIKTGSRDCCGQTVVRDLGNGSWMLMNRRDEGFGEYGFEYPSIEAVFRAWNVYPLWAGRDKHSRFVEVISKSTPRTQ